MGPVPLGSRFLGGLFGPVLLGSCDERDSVVSSRRPQRSQAKVLPMSPIQGGTSANRVSVDLGGSVS